MDQIKARRTTPRRTHFITRPIHFTAHRTHFSDGRTLFNTRQTNLFTRQTVLSLVKLISQSMQPRCHHCE